MRVTVWIFAVGMWLTAGLGSVCAQDEAFPKTIPKTLIECEGSGPCNGLWTFDGMHGQAQWPKQGTVAVLSVVRFDPEQIVIKRVDTSNPGFSAEYIGALNGDTMNGTVIWVWPGHWDDKPKSGVWHATVDDSLVLPSIAARVEHPTSHHFNLNGVWRSSNSAWLGGGVLATLRILQNGDRVQITAMDATTGFDTLRYDGRYHTGSIAGRLLEITNDADSAVTGEPAKPTWSDLSLRVDSADVITVPNGYVFRTSDPGPDDALCDSRNSSHVARQYAYLRGRAAFRTSEDYAKAACWFHAAAARGDGHSEAILALMFDQGYPGVPRSYTQALRWAKLSAAQGDYSGELALAMLYRNGHGTTADDRAADFWQSKAHKDYESDPDVRSATMAQNMSTVGGMLLGAMAAGVVLGASF